ncbi:MAG: type II toxin-antitoxin system VapC family toxin [Desulfosarcina sp.]
MADKSTVAYWDASAVLSILFKDSHSDAALQWAQRDCAHFISTLAYAEVCAVMARMKREKILSVPLVKVSFESLDQGPWRRLSILPDWEITKEVADKWKLRGADLWHLAAAKTLQRELPELILITFDTRLLEASTGENLVASDVK